MTVSNASFLFIPDISGFSEFVGKTEIDHSKHIISELLEIIIKSDHLGLKVSELEGDAVLFYRNDTPELKDIIAQCEETFINFHKHVLRYDTERICRCGACETAINLTLKFVAHSGVVEQMDVLDHHKLFGLDVILAHRLLKNPIPVSEYVLLTDKFSSSQIQEGIKSFEWAKIKSGSMNYPKIGEVKYSYIPTVDLHAQVEKSAPINMPGLSPHKFHLETVIHASVDDIYENFTNLEKRMQWNEDIKEIILENEKFNKSGAMHTCLIGNDSLKIESIGRMEDDDKIVYGERLEKFRGLRDIITIYTFTKKADLTRVKVDLDFKVGSFIGKIFKSLIRRLLIIYTKRDLGKLKIVSEMPK